MRELICGIIMGLAVGLYIGFMSGSLIYRSCVLRSIQRIRSRRKQPKEKNQQ